MPCRTGRTELRAEQTAPPSALRYQLGPTIGVGLDRLIVVPSPSWPSALYPQQYPTSVVVLPQVLCRLALTCANWSPPTTAVRLSVQGSATSINSVRSPPPAGSSSTCPTPGQ
jgi:hypothetical protein